MGFWSWLFGGGADASSRDYSQRGDRIVNPNLYPISPVSSGEFLREPATETNPQTGETTKRYIQKDGKMYQLAFFDTHGTPVYGNMPRIITTFDIDTEPRFKFQ